MKRMEKKKRISLTIQPKLFDFLKLKGNVSAYIEKLIERQYLTEKANKKESP